MQEVQFKNPDRVFREFFEDATEEKVVQKMDNRLQTLKKQYGQPASVVRTKIGRNDPCPCGSGLKFKKCCIRLSR